MFIRDEFTAMTLGNFNLSASSLCLAARPKIQKILNHPIILSLADATESQFSNSTNRISEAKLIEIRNIFYIQDYYYLTYGHELVRNVLLDRNSDRNSNKKINIIEPRSPLESTSIENLNDEIKRLGLSLITTDIHAITQEYLIYKIKHSLQSTNQAIVGNFACILVYYEIAKYFMHQKTKYALEKDHEELSKWVNIFDYNTSLIYYRRYKEVIDNLSISQESQIKLLTDLFVRSCEFEYLFFDSLLN